MADIHFSPPSTDKQILEEGFEFTPRFGTDGLLTAVVTDAQDGAVLMVAHMNAEALAATLSTGTAHFWSRSRKMLWRKGETSGNTQRVIEMLTDCDQDAVLLRVEVGGRQATCHTGRKSCFYRTISIQAGSAKLTSDGNAPLFDPAAVYAKGR